jgi:hypothetical protein
MDDIVKQEGVEDLAECFASSRRPEQGARIGVRVGDADLDFQRVVLDDLEPTARQILDAAGLRPVESYLLFAFDKGGVLAEIGLDETVELWDRRINRFLAFKSERSFRFMLEGRRFEWGQDSITGRVLKVLANVNPRTHGVWLERRDEPDLLIEDDNTVNLAGRELERFRTGKLFFLCIEGTLHPWSHETITMEQIAALGDWDPSEGVIEVDADQNERQLGPGEIVTLKPGTSYGKRIKWKRGA